MTPQQLAEITTVLPSAILERTQTLNELRERLSWLNEKSCTGTEYWRNRNHPTREPKLYINHGIDQPCPVHGVPDPGTRIRTYIGSDEENITQARQWLGNELERQCIQDQVSQLEYAFERLEWRLGELFRVIGYTSGNGDLPAPDPAWTPEKARLW
jgi:hypothetical protein